MVSIHGDRVREDRHPARSRFDLFEAGKRAMQYSCCCNVERMRCEGSLNGTDSVKLIKCH